MTASAAEWFVMADESFVQSLFDTLASALEEFAEFLDSVSERGRLKEKNSELFLNSIVEKALGKPERAEKILKETLEDIASTLGIAVKSDIERVNERLRVIRSEFDDMADKVEKPKRRSGKKRETEARNKSRRPK